jgi:pimeloyl-ACP methyl ester carboxylesterase
MQSLEIIYASIAAIALYLVVRIVLRHLARPRDTNLEFVPGASGEANTLVVMVHGLAGRRSLQRAERLVNETLPDADRLIVDYAGSRITNLDPYEVADAIERGIHETMEERQYTSIILFGHSAGACLLRKAFVWGHGREEDRFRMGRRGKHAWVNHVERCVLLAGMNRGWSIAPRPAQMSLVHYVLLGLGQVVSRLFGIARFAMSMRRGSPFIADTRVQWIQLVRSDDVVSGKAPLPTVIQLIGSKDDIVSREDGQDLLAARDTVFVTLPQTGHRDIGGALDGANTPGAENRLRRIAQALQGRMDLLGPDRNDLPAEDRSVTRLIYVLHGIRDYGNWTDVLRDEIQNRCRSLKESAVVVNMKYGYFPMLPFITYSDRQRNVRRFMDRYTEDLARYPNAVTVDFVGHSNGTYILASALQHYATIKVRRVFFAGSVVPKHYPWQDLNRLGRVERVANVVATSDWVVAIFPKVFEQISDLRNQQPTTGFFDLGSAGFRGFLESDGSAVVRDLKFSPGEHSTGVEISDRSKLDAIAGFVAQGDEAGFAPFCTEQSQNAVVDVLSNISLLLWIGLIAVLILVGVLVFSLGGVWCLVLYAAAVVLLLNMI